MKQWVLVVCAVIGMAGLGDAAELAGVKMPDTMNVWGQDLVLNGLGLRSATIFGVKVYVAGLYLPAKSSDPKQILDMQGVKFLRLQFVRDVEVAKIREAWTEGIKKNADAARCAAGLAQINAMMRDMANYDVMDLIFTATGIGVKIKGADIGSVADPAFARSMLAIWLGQSPPNAELKQGLLGLK